jgi:hypothetical protein
VVARIFLDLLDTVRARNEHPLHSLYVSSAKRTMLLELLLGNVLALTEAQALDSAIILDAVVGAGRASFIDLVRARRIVVPMLGDGLAAAMLTRLADPKYIFSAWNATWDRKALMEAIRTGRLSNEIRDSAGRVEALRQLDSALQQAPYERAEAVGPKIVSLVTAALPLLPKEFREHPKIKGGRLPRRRSRLYEVIDGLAIERRRHAKEIVDACYNIAMADGVQARPLLTGSLLNTVQDVATISLPARVTPLVGFDAELDESVALIDWPEVHEFLRNRGFGPVTERDLRDAADHLGLLWARSGKLHIIASHVVGAAAGGLITGVPAALGALPGGSEGVVIGTALGAALPAVWNGDSRIEKGLAGLLSRGARKRFFGIFRGRA